MVSAAWFIDGGYLDHVWTATGRTDKVDFLKLRRLIETRHLGDPDVRIGDAYYFDADVQAVSGLGRLNQFHCALQYPPPNGPGLRVKRYWVTKQPLYWPASWGGGPVCHPDTGRHYELVRQKGVDVALATTLMRSFVHQRWHTLFLLAGDADFYEPVQYLVEQEGVRLVLVGSVKVTASCLLSYANAFIDLPSEADKIALTSASRA